MRLLILFFLVLGTACTPPSDLERILQSEDIRIRQVIDEAECYEVQIIYTQIDRDAMGSPQLTDYTFREDEAAYFYPASTVKLPAAMLALEFVESLDSIDRDTPYLTVRDTLVHTLADDVRQIFAVSDNEAYNRIYELLGRDYMNTRLREKGITPIRLSHRLSTQNADAPARSAIQFITDTGDTLRIAAAPTPDSPVNTLDLANIQKGKGYIKEGQLVAEPFDFSTKNHFPLQAQHALMKRLFFPNLFPETEWFTLFGADRDCVLQAMSLPPRLQGYNETEYNDSYGKFLMYGDIKTRIPNHIKIYNKVGYAYGTLTETAYIMNIENGIEFLVSATLLLNDNGIFNDDTYEYEEIGIPFLAQLGREIYALEKARRPAVKDYDME